MRPVPYIAPWFTTDLTCGYPHKVTSKEDGSIRYVILFPKTWEPEGEKRKTPINGGKDFMMVQTYRVLTWEERELVLANSP